MNEKIKTLIYQFLSVKLRATRLEMYTDIFKIKIRRIHNIKRKILPNRKKDWRILDAS